jgi:hypothetical protein
MWADCNRADTDHDLALRQNDHGAQRVGRIPGLEIDMLGEKIRDPGLC